ncbi:DUF3710 domain-containing protein, partial [Frankia sp. CpI1-P]
MFGRGRRESDQHEASRPQAPERRAPVAKAASVVLDGPYDVTEVPEDDLHRLDLGSLRIPALPGVQVQFQVEEATGQ